MSSEQQSHEHALAEAKDGTADVDEGDEGTAALMVFLLQYFLK